MTDMKVNGAESETLRRHTQGYEDRLYHMMLWVYITVLPAAALFFCTATIADSMALFVNLAWYLISFAVQTFSLYAIWHSNKRNPGRFPHGTGKLENFSAFLDGILCIPIGLYLAGNALERIIMPLSIGYAIGVIPVIITGIRQVIFYTICHRLIQETKTPSPILQSYTISFRVGMLSSGGVLGAFIVGWTLIIFGFPDIGNRIDPAIGLVMALYMIGTGAGLVWHNFRSLMDLPLTEDEQLQVIKVLTTFYDRYDGIGIIYTRTSGNEKFVELELFFPAEKTLGDIQGLQSGMEQALATELPGLRFRIIPKIQR